MGERHPMIVHYERIMENYDSDRVAAKLRDFLEEAQRIAKVDYAAEMRAQAARRPWWDRLLDRLVFALMGLVAVIDRRVWSKGRGEVRPFLAGAWRTNPRLTPGRLLPGLPWFDWQMRRGVPLENYWQPDGWKAARYV